MQLEVIYSFSESFQKRVTSPFTSVLLNNQQRFFEFVTSILTDDERKQLVKISCCIYYAYTPKPVKAIRDASHWYNMQQGKFYDNLIRPLMEKIWKVKCTYPAINI